MIALEFLSLPQLFTLVGLPILLSGASVWHFGTRAIAVRIEEVARLPVTTLATLPTPGTPILLEAGISDVNPPSDVPPLVAYEGYRRPAPPLGDSGAAQDSATWERFRSHHPALYLDVVGGQMQVEPGYFLRDLAHRVDQGPDLMGEVRYYEGLQVFDAVLVLGVMGATTPVPTVQQAQIMPGASQQSYLADLRAAQQGGAVLGQVLMVMGGGFLGVAGFSAIARS